MAGRLPQAVSLLLLSLFSAGVWAVAGDLDTTFGGGSGWVSTKFRISGNQDYGSSVIQQMDGKLVVAGYSYNGSNDDFAIARYNSDGSLDFTFNGSGKVITAFGSGKDRASAVIQQADGKLVTAGSSYNGSNDDIALARYNSDGSLDLTFNGSGKVVTAIGSGNDRVSAVIQQVDGKLVVAGGSVNGGSYDFAIVRYNADGSLDTSFNGSGKVVAAIGIGYDEATSIIQQTDDKLVVAGVTRSETGNDNAAVVRYNGDGSLDITFNGTGKVITAIGADDSAANSVIQQKNGKLVIAGYSGILGGYREFSLVRYSDNGSLDLSFNGTGKVTTAIGVIENVASSIIQQSDGKLVAAGFSFNSVPLLYDFTLVRYNNDGSLDATFGNGGKAIATISNKYDQASSIIQQTDGKLVLAGFVQSTGYEFAIARIESGQLDTDSDGIVDWLDADNDNDGVVNASDTFPLDATKYQYARHDMNVDFDSDVLTRSTSSGIWTSYAVQSAVITTNTALNIPTDSDTQYIAQLDANGDGDADVLTRSASTGAWTLYQVQNGAVTGSVALGLFASLDWHFVGTGDFNGDGTDDVLLRSTSTGLYNSFLINNYVVSSVNSFNAWSSSLSVDQGIGDFDGDGTDDLLIRRTTENAYFVFKVVNGLVSNYYCACNLWYNPDWTFQFAGDTNNDGTDDIVVRATGASGDGLWWNFKMNNFVSTQVTNLNLFSNKTRVSLGAVGDYNADGSMDVLTRVDGATTYVSPITNGLVTSNNWLQGFSVDQVIQK